MFKKLAKMTVRGYLSYLFFSFLWGVVYSIGYQRKHGLGAKPTKQEIANAYFGIKA